MRPSRHALGRLLHAVTSSVRRPGSARPPSGSVPPLAVDVAPADEDEIGYAPREDGNADPGEVVWAWVTYEDDPQQGKDRPVLVVGRRGSALLGLMLTSRDHDRDAADEARWGRHWMDVGTGAWDRERRPSEVRLDRLLVLDEDAVRREGAALDRRTFDAVLAAARPFHDRR